MQAPICRVSGVDLVLAVANGGGLGTLSGTYLASEELRQQIRTIHRRTDAAFCVNSSSTSTRGSGSRSLPKKGCPGCRCRGASTRR